jgi:(S)-2-hydroxyglutarate dehydrogenase
MERIAVVGGGILGVAVARELQLRRPGVVVTVLEKEQALAQHQTGRNSGVVHAGIYYTPGSLKARLCVEGAARMREYVAEHRLPYEECGKLIVALDQTQVQRLDELERRARANGLTGVRRVAGAAEIQDLEPHAAGVEGLHSPHTGITDFAAVTRTMAGEVTAQGGEVRTGAEVVGVTTRGDGVELRLRDGAPIRADAVVACAGLQSDRFAGFTGDAPEPRIVPFRGGYHALRPERRGLVRGLIYPVPDPRFPFLGIHLTKRVDGEVLVGPHAVLALGRERYGRRAAPDLRDLGATLAWPGTARLAARHWRTGLLEMHRTVSTKAFVEEARRYVPELRRADVVPAVSGIRAQALRRDGSLEDDFVITRSGPVTHVRNAPSPAATSSLAIAAHVVDDLVGAL